MVSYKNLFLIKGMTCWNGVTDWFRRAGARVYSWYESVAGWFDPSVGNWYMVPNGIFPIPHTYRYGLESEPIWEYRPKTGELLYKAGSSEREKKQYEVAWLSARTKRTGSVKDMDGFLSELRVYPDGHDLPLSVLLQAWSLYDRHWWTVDPSVQIEWIDRMAEEHSVVVTEIASVPLVPSSPKN